MKLVLNTMFIMVLLFAALLHTDARSNTGASATSRGGPDMLEGNGSSDSKPTTRETYAVMQGMFEEGLKRPFGAGGPRFNMPDSYYAFFCAHPREALDFLRAKLVSNAPAADVNALDFLGYLAFVNSVRREVEPLLQEAATKGGLAAKNVATPALEALARHDARRESIATRPSAIQHWQPLPTSRKD